MLLVVCEGTFGAPPTAHIYTPNLMINRCYFSRKISLVTTKLLCPENILTRLHSSRMRTARTLTISPSMLCTRGGGATSQGCLGRGASRGVSSWGVPPPGGLPPVNRMTNRCKNITLPQTSFAGGNNISDDRVPTRTGK